MKRIINTLFFMFAAITMTAQNSFIVADKNGNSQLVQSLIFQQQQNADRFTWKSDGNATGDIKDLLFIARSQAALATASKDEVIEMLEELSGTDQADAEGIAVTLDKNENVEQSFSSDDSQSLFVQFKEENDDVYSVYPMKQLYDPFEDETDDYSSYVKNNSRISLKAAPNYRKTGSRGKVAVFNYFSNQITRETQNRMLEYMMQDLNDHDFGVEYYPFEKMTLDNLLAVYESSADYTAVVIISHGFSKDNVSYFVTGEEYDANKKKEKRYIPFFGSGDPESDKVPFSTRFWNEGLGAFTFDKQYVFALRVKNFELPGGVILYMGSCDAYPDGKNKKGTCVGWSGTQSIAQAHVTLMFYNLMRGKTLKDALDDPQDQSFYYYNYVGHQLDTWKVDVMTKAVMECQFRSTHDLNPPKSLTTHKDYYFRGAKWLDIDKWLTGPVFLSDKEYKLNFKMDDVASTGAYPDIIYIKATPLRSDASPIVYSVKRKKNQSDYKSLKLSLPQNGIYVITAAVDEEFTKEILLFQPIVFVKAKPFKENGMDWDEDDDEDDDDPVGTETFTVNGVSFTMVGVDGGTFWMGATDDDGDADSNERPRHEVTLGSFAIGQTEVTQELWEAVMGSNPSYFKGGSLPVERVSWNDCQEFLTKLNALTGRSFRLPTEAEWEYAARGGSLSRGYKYSGSDDVGAVAWYWDNSGSTTHAVGTKAPNELGLYDMSGNVWEWCQDWYSSSYYNNSPATNPCNTASASDRVCRGGGWSGNARFCRVAYRDYSTPGNRYYSLGLRLAH